jgi:hypothetical protein
MCSTPGCDRPPRTKGASHCDRCRSRLRARGTTDPAPPRVLAVNYHAIHSRMRAERGSASEHPCKMCGGQAQDWSLFWPERDSLRWDPTIGKVGALYSVREADYVALCRRDHYAVDRRLRAIAEEVAILLRTPVGEGVPLPDDLGAE